MKSQYLDTGFFIFAISKDCDFPLFERSLSSLLLTKVCDGKGGRPII